MATATIVSTFVERGYGCLAARVEGDSVDGVAVEYIGRVPLADLTGKTNAEKKAMLVAAVKVLRDAQAAPAATVAQLSGTVEI